MKFFRWVWYLSLVVIALFLLVGGYLVSKEFFLQYELIKYRQIDETSSQSDQHLPEILAISGIGVLELNWLGTDLTGVDLRRHKVLDLTDGMQKFLTRVQVISSLSEAISIFAVMDGTIIFRQTVSPYSTDELFVRVDGLSYGEHKLLVYAELPGDKRTADVVFPFAYLPGTPAKEHLLR